MFHVDTSTYNYTVHIFIINAQDLAHKICVTAFRTCFFTLVCVVRLFRKKESAEVGRDPAVSMLNLANHHNSYSNKSYHINIFRPITA